MLVSSLSKLATPNKEHRKGEGEETKTSRSKDTYSSNALAVLSRSSSVIIYVNSKKRGKVNTKKRNKKQKENLRRMIKQQNFNLSRKSRTTFMIQSLSSRQKLTNWVPISQYQLQNPILQSFTSQLKYTNLFTMTLGEVNNTASNSR